jgi:hypothetical protein
MRNLYLAILGILWGALGVAYGQDSSTADKAQSVQAVSGQEERSAAQLKLFDSSGNGHRSFRDWNGTPRTTDFLLENAVASDDSVTASSSVVFMPQITGSSAGGRGQEIDAVLFFPKIVRPSTGAPAPTISGVAVAAPIDGGGGVAALDAATLRVESNPPVGMGVKSWALAVDAGDVKIGNHLYFPNPSGIQQARGDMIFNNLDTSEAGTISFYSGGGLRMRMQPSGVVDVPAGLAVGSGGATLAGIYRMRATLNYPAIAGQSCHEQDVDVPKATQSGSVMASPAESLGSVNLYWSAWVSESDKVKVRVCNPTSDKIRPNQVTWNVTVIQ